MEIFLVLKIFKFHYQNLLNVKLFDFTVKNLVCGDSNLNMDRWTSRLANCGWLQNVCDVITTAATVAQCVHCEGIGGIIFNEKFLIKTFPINILEVPVVVHGAEGTDTTLLVTSIAQLCLDTDARTLRGFILIFYYLNKKISVFNHLLNTNGSLPVIHLN